MDNFDYINYLKNNPLLKENKVSELEKLLGKPLHDKENIGRHSLVYIYKPDPSKVIKINKNINDDFDEEFMKDIYLMKKHPSLSVKIYEINKKYIIVERLQQIKVNKDLWDLREEFKKYKIWDGNYFIFEDIKNFIMKNTLNKIEDAKLKIKDNHVLEIFNKYVIFINNVIKEFKPHNVDIHQGNIGYDIKGNLKVLDI